VDPLEPPPKWGQNKRALPPEVGPNQVSTLIAILALQLAGGVAVARVQLTASSRPGAATAAPVALEPEPELPALPVAAPDVTVPPEPVSVEPPPESVSVEPPPAPVDSPPAPEPVPVEAPAEAPPSDPMERVETVYREVVPAEWRAAIAVRFELIDGNTSYASPDGTVQISSVHANGRDALLRATIAHEFGHLVAFSFGSQAFNGAAPEGWPSYSDMPEEAWADCVSRALTGLDDPSHGLPSCEGDSLSWTADWMAAGPSAHHRTAR
jgi:hypothetical protein